MPYLSLYRKYRSQNFTEIVGQDHITTTLTNAIERDRIAHAYLFSGPRGTGKTSTARIMAKCINCESGPTATPCNTCPVCTAITKDKLFDVIEIDAASNRGIDDVRDLKEKVRVPPTQARRKVYIIDEVHMLTREAFNALLKTLEEPPEHVLFIMATTEPQKLPPTILSRCQRFDFRRLTDKEITGHIQNLCTKEGFAIDAAAADMIVRTADGSLRDAISILDQLVSFSSGAITAADANLMFGLVEKKEIISFMASVFDGDAARAFDLFQQFFDAGKSFSLFLRLVMEHLRDLYLMRQGLTPPRDTYSEDERAALLDRAQTLPRPAIVALLDEVARVEDRIRWEVYPRIILEILIIKMIDIASADGLAAPVASPAKKKPSKPKAQPPRQEEPLPQNPAASPADAAGPLQPTPEQAAPDQEHEPGGEAPGYLPPDEEDLQNGDEPEPEIDSVIPGEPPAAAGDFTAIWKAILANIKKTNMPRYYVFADARASMPDEHTFLLTYMPEHQFKKENAQEKESMDLLREAVNSHFGRNLRIKLQIDRGGDEPVQDENSGSETVEPVAPAEPIAQNLSLFDQVREVFPKSVEIE